MFLQNPWVHTALVVVLVASSFFVFLPWVCVMSGMNADRQMSLYTEVVLFKIQEGGKEKVGAM